MSLKDAGVDPVSSLCSSGVMKDGLVEMSVTRGMVEATSSGRWLGHSWTELAPEFPG